MTARPTVLQVPTNEDDRIALLIERPAAWEYLLFGSYLRAGITRVQPKWRDYSLGYTMLVAGRVSLDQLPDFVQNKINSVSAIARNVDRVISEKAQEAAFGLPGQEGDPEMIAHMADRLIQMYESMLDWAADFNAHRFPADSVLGSIGAGLVWQPITATREFVTDFIAQLEGSLEDWARSGELRLRLAMELKYELGDEQIDRLNNELRRVLGSK